MTINSTSRKAGPFNGTGAQTAFPFTFKIFVQADLRVVLTDAAGMEADQVLNAAYTVVINADQENTPGGTVTMLAAPAVGAKLTITSVVPITQGQSIPNNSGFYPRIVENAYDKLTIICQQLAEQVGRSVKFAISDASTGNNMPPAAQRANNLLGFDAAGNMIAVAPAAQSATALQALLGTLTGSSLIGFLQAGVGAVLRTMQSKARDVVSIKDFGGVGDDATDNTTALINAINSLGAAGGCVRFPAGTYRITPTSFSNLNNITLEGVGRYNSIIRLSAAGIAMRFNNCQWLTIRNLYFGQTGAAQSLAGAVGVQLDGNSSNGLIEDCGFFAFAGGGVNVNGLPGAAQSGNQVINNYFIGNGGTQLRFASSNDFHIEGNQFGYLLGVAGAAIGCLLDTSSAGSYTNNYHWNNTIGCKSINSFYNRIIGNRFEENGRQGLWLESANNCIVNGNTFHTNSLETYGAYDNAYFKNLVQCVISNNTSFDFSGGVSNHRWGMYIDNACDGVSIHGNKASGYTAGPIYINPINLNTSHDVTLPLCMNTLFAAAGASTYLGPAGQNANELPASWTVGRRAIVQSFYINSAAAPGAAQTYTFTIYKNGVATTMTGTISGNASFLVEVGVPGSPVLISERDRISLRVDSTGGAAPTYIIGAIKLDEF